MLLHFLLLGLVLGLGNRARHFVLAQAGDRDGLARQGIGQFQRRPARGVGIVRRIGQDHDGRLQAFRAVHGHHPHFVAVLACLALQLALARVEPLDEGVEARHLAGRKSACGIEQFVNRIACFSPQPRHQLAPPLPRTRQDPVEQRLRRVVIGNAQQLRQLLPRTVHHRLAAKLAQMIVEVDAFGPPAVVQQVVLAPPDQRRDEQAGKVQIVKRLRGKAQRGHQVAHRQRRGQPQPVHPGHGDASRVEPRHDQTGQFLALAHQHHDIAGRRAPRLAVRFALYQRKAVVHPCLDLPRDAVSQLPVTAGEPAFLPLFRRFAGLAFIFG